MSLWSRYQPSDTVPWNLSRVVHLHRRAGFAATWAELQRDLHDGPEQAVMRLLNGTSHSEGVPDNFEDLSTVISRSAVDAGDAGRLKAWWVYRCLFTPDPLGERLTLMWHNHFATSLVKVTDLAWMFRQNQTFRRLCRGEFQTLLAAMLDDPALLRWLDAPENRPGHPNENLAREMMELFALGIGNYTEHDIREMARALTGLMIEDGVVKYDPAQHDAETKTIFGQTGAFAPRDLPGLLASHSATAQRLAWRLCREFLGENVVSLDALNELATGLRANQLRIDWAVETILRSELFFGDSNLRSRAADPAGYLLGPLRACECFRQPPSTLAIADSLRRMGLDLFAPPNVGGWPGGRAWLSTRTVIARTNAAADFVDGRLQLPTAPFEFQPLLDRHHVGDSVQDAIRFLGQLFWGDIDPGLVEMVSQSVPQAADRPRQLRRIVLQLLTQPRAQLH